MENPNRLKRLSQYGKFFSTQNAYITIVILITGAKVMPVLCFAKNKFPNLLSLSNSATPSAPGIFTQNMDQKKLPHKKSAKNNNSNYQNKNHQLNCKISR